MNKTLSSICLFLSLLCFQPFAMANEDLDQIIAVVNEDVITQSEFNKAYGIVKAQAAQQSVEESTLKKQVLDQLINKRLQLQLAKQANIKVSDEDLNNAIADVAKSNNISTATLYERVNLEGMSTSDYREEIRDQMTLQKLQQQEVISKISISPDEVDRYAKNKRPSGIKEYEVEDILVPINDNPTEPEIASAKKRAETITNKLNRGEPARLVLEKAKNESYIENNAMGWLKINDMPSAFAKALVNVNSKQIAGPIKTGNGFHILNVKDVRLVESEDTPDRKQIEQALMKRKFDQAVQTWVSKLRGQAFIVANK